jgi:hypothetical protein
MKSKFSKIQIIIAFIVIILATFLTGCTPKLGGIATAKSDIFITSGGHYVCQINRGDKVVVDVISSQWDEQVHGNVTYIGIHKLNDSTCKTSVIVDLVN